MPGTCLTHEKIQEYLDNNLSQSEKEIVAAHIESCAACRRDVAAFTRLFEVAAESARQQTNAGVSRQSVDAVMQRLQTSRSAARVAAKSDADGNFDFFRWIKWHMMPALAVIMLIVLLVADRKTPDSAVNDALTSGFSLLDNSVMPVMGELPPGVKNRIIPGSEVSLGEDAILLVSVDQHKFKFSGGAVFVLSKNEIELRRGNATFDLTGSHNGFRVITPAVTVTPMGTSFELTLKSWGTMVALYSGRLELASKGGLRRVIDAGQTIYITTDGKFSSELPQPESGNLPGQLPPSQSLPLPQSTAPADAPGSLIDSL